MTGRSSDPVLEAIKKFRNEQGQALRAYRFALYFPTLRHSDESPLPCRETKEELEACNHNFSAQVKDLFNALVDCEAHDAKAGEEASPYLSSDGISLTIMTQLQSIDNTPSCRHRTYLSNRLSLLGPDEVPDVSCVTKLRLVSMKDYATMEGFANVRPISPRVPIELLTHLPAMRELECPWLFERTPVAFPSEPMRHYTRPWEGPWRDSRNDFAQAVQDLGGKIPTSLTRARLWFYRAGYMAEEDQSAQMPNLVFPAQLDPFSLALHTLALHLEELDLRAFITPQIFGTDAPWPRMKRLRVEFHPLRPDGSWYFVGPEGEDPNPEGFKIGDEHYPPTTTSEEDKQMDDKYTDYNEEYYEEDDRRQDMFRIEPLADRIEPLLASFAGTLKSTSSLEEAELFTNLVWSISEELETSHGEGPTDDETFYRWGLKYTAAKGESMALLEWQVGDWRPSETIIELYESLGGDSGVETTWKAFEFKEERPQDDPSAFV